VEAQRRLACGEAALNFHENVRRSREFGKRLRRKSNFSASPLSAPRLCVNQSALSDHLRLDQLDPDAKKGLAERWILKQVQEDGMGMCAFGFPPNATR
jgi:uncharacterized protein (DUF1786 family)